MVLVEDVTGTNNSSGSGSGSSSSTNQQQQNTSTGGNVLDYMSQDKISAVLWLTRLFTIGCTILFIVPLFGYDQLTLYSKALMAGGATSALKLHQRINAVPFQLNREYLAKLLIEDSFHYLLYSMIFLNTQPVTMCLMPVFAFAVLHVTAYTNNILNISGGPNSMPLIRKVINFISSKDKDIMRFVAVNEILMAPTIIFMIITGKCGIFVPFIYYRFICMRFSSRRNPYSRVMFYELRVTLEQLSMHPSCPQIARSMCQRLIGLVIRFAPQGQAL